MYAAINGNAGVVRTITNHPKAMKAMEEKDGSGATPLMLAALRGNQESVKVFCEISDRSVTADGYFFGPFCFVLS